MAPNLSIITVLFNPIKNGRKDMLIQAISSVANQKYDSYEHIIVDGGSADGTVELLAEYKQSGIITNFISEPDKGIYDAMNKGAAMAKGQYIAFLNSDDYYFDTNAFAKISKALNHKYDYCYGPVKIEAQDGSVTGYFKSSVRRFLTKMPFAHQSLFVKKSIFNDLNGFDLEFKLAADYDFIVRMYLKGYQGIQCMQPFSIFRMGGLSDLQDDQGKAEKIKVWEKNYGKAEYLNSIESKTLPFSVFWPLLKRHPKHILSILLELIRTLRKNKSSGKVLCSTS